jgi:hypothetical protein
MTAREVFARLATVLGRAGIEYMLTGSFASAYHGRARATQDIDIVINATPEQLHALKAQLPEPEYYFDIQAALRARQREGLFQVIDTGSGWKVDFILLKSRPFSLTEFSRRAEVELEGVRLPIASPEDVLLAKLEWASRTGSERQIGDAAGILSVRGVALDQDYIGRWVQELGVEKEWDAARRASAPPPTGT